MQPPTSLLAAGLLMAAGAAAADDTALRNQARLHFEAVPTTPIASVGDHAISAEQVTLGAMLFFDPRMSASGIFSCHSCHNVGLGGMDGLETSIGHGWQKGPRNAPTVFNAVFNIAQFWDGRAPDLAEQAKGPVQAGVEMANTPTQVLVTLQSMQGYQDAFQDAFPGEPEPISFNNFARAIEAFETTLITPNAPFDRWLMGDDAALNEQQKQGLADFLREGCAVCHNGVNIGGNGYYPFGVVDRPGGEILPEGDRGAALP